MSSNKHTALRVVALVVAFALGRYTLPERVVTKTVEIEKKVENTTTDIDRDKHKETTVTETVRPDGTKEKVTKTIEDVRTEKKVENVKVVDKDTTKTKEVTHAASRTHISALAGARSVFSSDRAPVYGAVVSRSLIGPITGGVWGLTSGTVGVTIGLSF